MTEPIFRFDAELNDDIQEEKVISDFDVQAVKEKSDIDFQEVKGMSDNDVQEVKEMSENDFQEVKEMSDCNVQDKQLDDDPYCDMYMMNRPVSKNHKPMSLQARAAQFAPFAALTGHKDVIMDTAKKQEEMVLSELEKVEVEGI